MGKLHTRNAHTTTGTVDQHTLAGHPARPLEQCVIGRAIRHVDGRPLGEGGCFGEWIHAFGRADREFGVGTTAGASNVDPITYRDALDFRTNGGNDTSTIIPWRI